jgi:cyclopropane-fatty-acyl-phospholipid synthase
MSLVSVETLPATIDSARWPAIAELPSGPVATASAAIADRLLRRAAVRLPLRLIYPDGTVIGGTGSVAAHCPALTIHQPDALARRIGRRGLIGFGESYMAGDWSSDDLTAALTVLAESVADLVPRWLHWLRPIAPAFQPSWRDPSRDQARRNVAEHYDLSNDLFAEFLDETMVYSSALFEDLPATWSDLAAAQQRKLDRLLDLADVGSGTRVLEIGTGWGELCIRAAARGAHVRSVTLSVEQQRLARQRVAAAGLSHLVEIDLCDYRDAGAGSSVPYDAVISVEMIEAVGYHAWPRYFTTLEQLVRPGGRVAIQAITMPHERMLASRNTHTWIQKYIFPGGLLPSTDAIIGITERHTNLRTVDTVSLQPHYAETLRLWLERFLKRRNQLACLGFDEVFERMWEFYLAYSEAGFRSGYLDVFQWTFERKGVR